MWSSKAWEWILFFQDISDLHFFLNDPRMMVEILKGGDESPTRKIFTTFIMQKTHIIEYLIVNEVQTILKSVS